MEAPGTRLYVDFVWRRAAPPRSHQKRRSGARLERVYTLTLYGGVPLRRLWCERGISLGGGVRAAVADGAAPLRTPKHHLTPGYPRGWVSTQGAQEGVSWSFEIRNAVQSCGVQTAASRTGGPGPVVPDRYRGPCPPRSGSASPNSSLGPIRYLHIKYNKVCLWGTRA